ncbi:LLM class F420-dependent oxidoreductase [Euzebya tangerina]|uniref:LLM class F420-dependent oxidoreductase n=1 Tax=Euzebya tangerina TaxID=591198 RepID=UPI000E31A7EF|nr:LLM class F420-dependent oxidoreductase [Euzebya tangerina]
MSRQAKVGIQLHPQATTMSAITDAAKAAEDAGADSVWTWDHFFPLYGDADAEHFEGWMTLSAIAHATERVQVGHLVVCNSYRNPELLADMARTLDHAAGGRVTLGIGSGWFERDYTEYGYEFGTAIGRLHDLRDALPRIKSRLAALNPGPVGDLPLLIGGGGEKVTLRLVAQHADAWNFVSDADDALDVFTRKMGILDQHCADVGRDPAAIERTMLLGPQHVEQADGFIEAGAQHLILMSGAPFGLEPLEDLIAAVS